MYPIMEEILIHTMTYFMSYREADGDTHYDLLKEWNVNYAGRVLWIYLNGSKIGKEIAKEKFKRVE